MKSKVSIIVPVYNAEKYISDTLDSILMQTYNSIEVILINDGSVDKSLTILQKYAEIDKRVKIIDKKNSGVSNTRNIGIDFATGEYICFVDSDDVLEPDYVSDMLEIAIQKQADLIVCGYALMDKRGKKRNLEINYKKGNIAENQSAFRVLLEVGLGISIWNKLIKREILNKYNIRFTSEMSFDEDMFFSWELVAASKIIYFCEKNLYNYRLTSGSAIMRYHESLYKKYCNEIKHVELFLNKYNLQYESFDSDVAYILSDKIWIMAKMIFRGPGSWKEKIECLENILSDSRISSTLTAEQLLKKTFWSEVRLKIVRMIR